MIVDFFVVGAARSGTTSIYNYLSQHPQVFLPNVKECNYFSDVESMDQEVYIDPELGKQYHMKIINSNTVYESLFKNAESEKLKGEVSPSYLWDRSSAKKISEHNKNAKIIISLRNPIYRAYSHYLMHYNTGYEKEKSFEDAIKAEKISIWGGGNLYLEMGLYYEQVKRYFEFFDPKNIKILIYEEWVKDIDEYINQIYNFLDLDEFHDFDLNKKHNKTIAIKNRKVINFFRQNGIKKALNKVLSDDVKDKIKINFFSKEGNLETLNEQTVKNLKKYFIADVEKLEKLIQIPLLNKWQLRDD